MADGAAMPRARLLLICSTGGHLTQLLALRDTWRDLPRSWVSFDKPDAVEALADERAVWAHHPTTRNLPNALRNLVLAVRTLIRQRPSVIVSTGAGVALPFFVVARLLRIRTIYLEVVDRIDGPSLTGRLCYPISDVFCVQWDEQLAFYPEAVVIGPTL